jgi:hypothetical protein
MHEKRILLLEFIHPLQRKKIINDNPVVTVKK